MTKVSAFSSDFNQTEIPNANHIHTPHLGKPYWIPLRVRTTRWSNTSHVPKMFRCDVRWLGTNIISSAFSISNVVALYRTCELYTEVNIQSRKALTATTTHNAGNFLLQRKGCIYKWDKAQDRNESVFGSKRVVHWVTGDQCYLDTCVASG